MPTSCRVRVNNITWGDTCGQSVLHPGTGTANNACGFSSLPKAWNAPGCGYTRCLEPETVLRLSQRHLGLLEGGEHVVFRHMVSPAFLAGQGWGTKGDLPLACHCVRWSRGRGQKFSG